MANGFKRYACDAVFNVLTLDDRDTARRLLVQRYWQFQRQVPQQISYLLVGSAMASEAPVETGRRRSDEGSLQQFGSIVSGRQASNAGRPTAEAPTTRKSGAENPPEEEPRQCRLATDVSKAALILRQEMELSNSRSLDILILRMSPDREEMLPILANQADLWRQARSRRCKDS